MKDLLRDVTERAVGYPDGLNARGVNASPEASNDLSRLRGPLPREVLALLDEVGSPATVATTGGRFFGFVTGGTLPAALAANWLAGAWDQNAFSLASSPAAVVLEEIALGWLLEALALPAGCDGAFVTSATMANFTALAAARHAVLRRFGWDVEADRTRRLACERETGVGALTSHPASASHDW